MRLSLKKILKEAGEDGHFSTSSMELNQIAAQHKKILDTIYQGIGTYQKLAKLMAQSQDPIIREQGVSMSSSEAIRQIKELLTIIDDDINIIKLKTDSRNQ